MKQAKTISIGAQYFDRLREKDCFYIDKTDFIRQWWDAEDVVTLITRPRRFGKTLNMSMLDCFFPRAIKAEENYSMVCRSGGRSVSGNCREQCPAYF